MNLKDYLQKMVELKGADLFLSTGATASVKAAGKLVPVGENAMKVGEVKEIAYSVLNDEQKKQFEHRPELNLALSFPGLGRFRVNIFKQRAEVGMVIRHIDTNIPTMESLDLPPVLSKLIMEKRGLVLFVGATGSGKSTSLAALVNFRNINSQGHIITIEDPIEFVHKHQGCIVNQREVGVDTDSYEDALKNALRQAPDVIQIGEIRARETMDHALAFAETGHLCLSTLHANNANQALDRIINFFPEERRNQLLLDLSFNLKGIVSQRLIPSKDGKRVAAIEILLGTPLVLEKIGRGEIEDIKEIMSKSENVGMQTFDQALERLYVQGKITAEEALKNADSKNNLRLRLTMIDKEMANKGQAAPQASPASSQSQPAAPKNPFIKEEPSNKGASGTNGLSLKDE